MEYDGCLTVAAEEQDSLKRIAFVGAFAMVSTLLFCIKC